MAPKHRVVEGGKPLNYTCKNVQFRTNTSKGFGHGTHTRTRGSVLRRPLVDHGEYTLWLEHVLNQNNDEFYWVMWYKSGIPTIPLSGVLGKNDLKDILNSLSEALETV